MNTDLISRADAEALFRTARSKLNPSDYKTADEFNTRDLMLLNAEQMIHLLPSVTPQEPKTRNSENPNKCHTCKHYTSGENDGSCGSYICKGYSNWESEE